MAMATSEGTSPKVKGEKKKKKKRRKKNYAMVKDSAKKYRQPRPFLIALISLLPLCAK